MNMEKDVAPDQESFVAKKKKFNFEKFMQQWNTLDTNNYGGWPLSVKITIWLFIFFIIVMLGYFLIANPKMEEIDRARIQEQTLLDEFKQKDSKLRNLQQYQTQLTTMEANFNQQLEQLPKETEIPGLVEDINMTGVNAGLKFKNILLEPEIQQEFFIEQPISIEATGDYHAFGAFTNAVAALPRIVTLHDFVVTAGKNPDRPTDIPFITYAIKAKTYRYVGALEKEKEKEGEVKK